MSLQIVSVSAADIWVIAEHSSTPPSVERRGGTATGGRVGDRSPSALGECGRDCLKIDIIYLGLCNNDISVRVDENRSDWGTGPPVGPPVRLDGSRPR